MVRPTPTEETAMSEELKEQLHKLLARKRAADTNLDSAHVSAEERQIAASEYRRAALDLQVAAVNNLPALLARIEALEKALEKLDRILLPIVMTLAQRELVNNPVPDDAIILHFMGSGASDQVTAGEFREARAAARAILSDKGGE